MMNYLDTLKKDLVRYSLTEYGIKIPNKALEKFCPLIGTRFMLNNTGKFLWEAFFNQNERQYGDKYPEILKEFLDQMGAKFLVSGHIREPNGHRNIAERQLRINSSYGANPDKKTIAIIDARRKYESINELVKESEIIRNTCEAGK